MKKDYKTIITIVLVSLLMFSGSNLVTAATLPTVSSDIPLPQTELDWDSNTVLLEKFNGSTSGYVSGGVEYVDSIPNLDKALYLPEGSWIRYAPSGLTQLQNAGSIEFFIAPTAYSTALLTLQWLNTNSPPMWGYVLHLSLDADGKIRYSVWGGPGSMPHGTISIPLNTWSHIAITWDGSGSKIFVNGEIDVSTSTKIWPASPRYVYLGYWGIGNSVFIDEFRISKIARVRDIGTILNQPPVADIAGPYTGNEGSSIIFNGSGSTDSDGQIVSYEWDLDCDSQYDDATGVNPSYTLGDDYSGCIGLKVTDNDGLTDTDSTTVTVLNVAPTANAGSDQIVFAGDIVSFTGSMTDPGWLDTHTYEWDFDASDGIGIDDTGQAPTHIYYSAGTYIVTLTVEDDGGGVSTDTLTVIVKAISATIDCSPDTLNLKSNGKWVTCYIELPADYDVRKIDGATVSMNGIAAYLGKEDWAKAEANELNIMDHDNDGILERMVKFDRGVFQNILNPGQVLLTLAGKVFYNADLASFEGTDTIRVIGIDRKGKK